MPLIVKNYSGASGNLYIYKMDNMDGKGQFAKSFESMTVSDTDVNILLLGETAVGKSTFINAFTNYLEYGKFNTAEKNEVRCLIPTAFTVTDENFEDKIVGIGKDDNENTTMTESATLETRSYVFPINKKGIQRIRLIDTPGIGDTRGIDRDNENMENLMSYISHIENLHAICFLLKPNNTRLTVMFHYCIKQLLSRLEKGASKNIIFLFTNTRSTFYKPGDSVTALKAVLEDIRSKPPFVDIKFKKDNVFCLDNESFRYLIAVKNGVELGNRQSFVESWNQSVKECWRMLDYVTGKGNSKLTPHKVKNTISVNEARRIILQLSQPLADIAELINDNIELLERHNQEIQRDNLSIADLKENLYVPIINLRCKELKEPTTVCTANDCLEIYTVNGLKKYHYKQRCHYPCYLRNVPKENVGSPELLSCWAMVDSKCRICNCDYSSHMHIYYISETYDDKIHNEGVKAQIKDRKAALNETQKLVAEINSRKAAYENEKDVIIKTTAKFAHFLQRNAIAPYNDSFKAYMEYLIDREKSQNENCNFETIKHYKDLLRRYTEEKQILDTPSSSNNSSTFNITAASVFDAVQKLYELPHTGTKINELHSRMIQSQNNEHNNTEVVLKPSRQQTARKEQGTKEKQQISPNNRPHMKARNSSVSSDNEEYSLNQQQPTWQQSIPNLTYMNVPSYLPIPHNPYVQFPQAPNSNYGHQQHQSFQENFQQYLLQSNNSPHTVWRQQMYPNNVPYYANFQDFYHQYGHLPIPTRPMPVSYSNVASNNDINLNTRFTEPVHSNVNSSPTHSTDPSVMFNPNCYESPKNVMDSRLYSSSKKNDILSEDESNSDRTDYNTQTTSDDEDFQKFMRENLEHEENSSDNLARFEDDSKKNIKSKKSKSRQKDSISPEKNNPSKKWNFLRLF